MFSNRIAAAASLCMIAACSSQDESNGADAESPLAESENVIAPTDLASLRLGGRIDTPNGPEIDVSLIAGDVALGDLSSRVLCPTGVDPCRPSELPASTIYTYVHVVRPGFDDPNDEGFPIPPTVVPVQSGESFALDFPASGFTGVAGYAVEPAREALAEGINPVIACENGRITWTLPADAEWSTGETLTFFWQSTQPPTEALGEYVLIGDGREARGRGPTPSPGGAPLPSVCR